MAQTVTPDGIAVATRVEATTHRKIHSKVVDNILGSRTYMSRLLGMGKPFTGKTFDVPIKVTDSGLGEFFSGLDILSSAASDTLIELSFAHTAFAQPVVSIMLESFANAGPEQVIDLDVFKLEEAVAESTQKLGTAAFGTGSGDEPNGLGIYADDGTDVVTVGGQSRTTYTALEGKRNAVTGGALTLADLGTLDDDCSAAGIESETPNINVTTKTVWSLYERLLHPAVRAEYASVGYPAISLRGSELVKNKAELKGGGGFTSLSYRGNPVLKDDGATIQRWYMVNERYLFWAGRNVVPARYRDVLERVNLGSMKTLEGTGGEVPPTDYGWFFQKMQMMPNQAGMIGRFYVIGQVICTQPRRQGMLTGITTV